MRGGAALLLLIGCGRVGFDPSANASDANAVADAFDESRCSWTPATALTSLNTPSSESEPALSPDGRVLVFVSNRLGREALFRADHDGSTWSSPTLIAEIDSPADQGGPAWSPAGDALYFTSFTMGPLWIFVSSYQGGNFDVPTRAMGLESLSEQVAPTIRGDDLEMFYSSRLPPSTIQRAVRANPGDPWTHLGEVDELAAPRDVGYPGVSRDGLTLYYEATQSNGRFTIMRATRPSIQVPFGSPELVPALDGGRSDGDPELSADGSSLLLASDRASTGNFDLYVATRMCM